MFFAVPFLSLGVVLIAVAMMAPVHPLSWLWRTLCYAAAVPPTLASLGFMSAGGGATENVLVAMATVAVFASAPFAAAMSVAVAARLRGAS
jgi:hypothetical protein